MHHRQRRWLRLPAAELRHQPAPGGAQRVPPAERATMFPAAAGYQLAAFIAQEGNVVAPLVKALQRVKRQR